MSNLTNPEYVSEYVSKPKLFNKYIYETSFIQAIHELCMKS